MSVDATGTLVAHAPLRPSATLLVKLGSIARHAEELLSPSGHPFDKAAMDQLLHDPEVVQWMVEMDSFALLPVMR